MNRTAPVELTQIGLDPHAFKYSDDRSWRGPCPVCGGHRRFVVFTDHEWPMWNGWCDDCGKTIKAWQMVTYQITDEQRAAAQAKAAEYERIREQHRREMLAKFTVTELWQELHRRLSAEHVAQWEAWGVPVEWQNYLELGYTPDKAYYDATGTLKHTPAYTIPYFHYNVTAQDQKQFATMQYRLFNADNLADRYRFEHGLPATYYQTVPTDPIEDQVVICEGAKKGIVTRISLTNLCVLAVPSKGSWGGIVEAVKQCGRVHVLLDPDASLQAVRLARAIGKSAHVVRLNHKVDDLATQYGMTGRDFESAIRWERIV